MDSTDTSGLERRARRRYELARARRALLGFAPMFVIVAAAACLAHRPLSALAFGGATFVLGSTLLWVGRDVRRAVLPGLVAGLVPLTLALCANHVGHLCTGETCTTLCIPACTVGGIVAGLAVAAVGSRNGAGLPFWLAASAVAVLTGAMGCSCVGYTGVIGLGIGYVAGLVPGLLRQAFAKRST